MKEAPFEDFKGQTERVRLPKLHHPTSQSLTIYHQAVAFKQSATCKWHP